MDFAAISLSRIAVIARPCLLLIRLWQRNSTIIRVIRVIMKRVVPLSFLVDIPIAPPKVSLEVLLNMFRIISPKARVTMAK